MQRRTYFSRRLCKRSIYLHHSEQMRLDFLKWLSSLTGTMSVDVNETNICLPGENISEFLSSGEWLQFKKQGGYHLLIHGIGESEVTIGKCFLCSKLLDLIARVEQRALR